MKGVSFKAFGNAVDSIKFAAGFATGRMELVTKPVDSYQRMVDEIGIGSAVGERKSAKTETPLSPFTEGRKLGRSAF